MLANTCLADNLSTLSTFNWGKLQLLNVDFFVYIILIHVSCTFAVFAVFCAKPFVSIIRFPPDSFSLSTLSTFLCQKAVSPYISSLSYVFHKMRFSWNSFLSTLSTLLKTLDFTGFVGNFFLLFFTFLCYNLGRADGQDIPSSFV